MRRLTTMNFGACVGYTGTLGTRSANIEKINRNRLSKYDCDSFFHDKNYRWILECLDGGYQISTDLIEYMEDKCKILREDIHSHHSYSKKWIQKLKQQSPISSYHTTKRAQLQTVRSSENRAQLLQARHDAIQQVITTYRQQVQRMYPSERLGTVHKHYRTDFIKKSFKIAHSPVLKLSEQLEKLDEEKKKAQNALHNADVQYENLEQNSTISKTQLGRANKHREKKRNELQDVKDRILRIEQEYNQEQNAYCMKAYNIYEQCRELEKERLDQIQQTLIQFIQAIHPSEYSSEQDAIYIDLLSNIENQQNSIEDLDFWARAYHVNIPNETTSSETNDNNTSDCQINEIESLSTTHESESEDDETEEDD